jgi:hypothetical protein
MVVHTAALRVGPRPHPTAEEPAARLAHPLRTAAVLSLVVTTQAGWLALLGYAAARLLA